jgi:NAD(P)-dependent dehydrogenase (short-subunit alcohol dehydrogenase family)
MDLGLSGKTSVVTGGTSGIGMATADLLLAEGARVAICGRNPERLDEARSELERRHGSGNLVAETADVTKAATMQAFAARVGRSFGTLDLLVNNAGEGRLSTFAETTDEAWRAELEQKFFGQINTLRAFVPLLRKSGEPAIVGVNSLLALQPEPHMVCTSAARAGVQSLLKSMAGELAPHVRVNTIVLGVIESGQWHRRFTTMGKPGQSRDEWLVQEAKARHIPLQRFGRPEEVARAVAFLGSPAASYITGATLEISGGVSRFI